MASLSSLTAGSSASDKELIAGLAMTVSIMGSFFRKKKEEEKESSPIRVIQNFITSTVTDDRFKKHSKGLYERVDELIELTKPERIEPEELMPANDNVLEEQRQKEKSGFKFPSFLGFGRSLLLILRALGLLYRMIKRLFKSIFRVLKNIFRAIGRWLVRVLSKAVNFLKKLGGRLLNFAKRIAGRVFSYLKSSKFLSFMKNLFRGIKNAVFALGRFGIKAYNTIKNIVRTGAVLTSVAFRGGSGVIARFLDYIFKTGIGKAAQYLRYFKFLGPALTAWSAYDTYKAFTEKRYTDAAINAVITVAMAPGSLLTGLMAGASLIPGFATIYGIESSINRTTSNALNGTINNILNKNWSDAQKGKWLFYWQQGYNLSDYPVTDTMLEAGPVNTEESAPRLLQARRQSIRNNQTANQLVVDAAQILSTNDAARVPSTNGVPEKQTPVSSPMAAPSSLPVEEVVVSASLPVEEVVVSAERPQATPAPLLPPEPQYNGVVSGSGSMLQNYGEEPTNTFGSGLAGSSNVVLNNIFNNTKVVYVPMRYPQFQTNP